MPAPPIGSGAATAAYSAAGPATFSFSDTGTTKTLTNALEAAVGYDYQYEFAGDPARAAYLLDVIPFVTVDRNITYVSGKESSSSRENVSTGMDVALNSTRLFGLDDAENALTLSAYHLWDDIHDAQINTVHLVEAPILDGRLNADVDLPWSEKDVLIPLLDLRGDFGFYNDRGVKPAANPNYSQLGTRFGFDLSLGSISSDLTVTQVVMHQFARLRKDINTFNAGWTYNITKTVGVKASYENGNLETTGLRVQQWLVSLSVKL